jgi:hypothetical protein
MSGSDATSGGTALRNALWNLLYRVVSSTDRTGTAWEAVLRGSCLAFFKETIDDLPLADNEASRQELKRLFFAIPEHRVYDFLEFLLEDEHAGLKEADRKLIRRRLNAVLDEEGAPVRLLRDRFVPLPDLLSLDAAAVASEQLTLFDMAAARRHLHAALAFLARRPDPAAGEAVREAVLAVAAVVRVLGGEEGKVAVGTIAPVADRVGIAPELREGIEAVLRRAHAGSGLPGAVPGGPPVVFNEAAFLVVFCSSLIALLLPGEGVRRES